MNPEPHGSKSYNIIGEEQDGSQLAAAIAMNSGMPCTYENVDDEIVVMAFERLDLQPWLAAGNVEMLKYIREGNLADIDQGDYYKITGKRPTKFGRFVKEYLAPLIKQDIKVP